MTMTHDEMIAVIAAHRDGKTIQYRDRITVNTRWEDCTDNCPAWEFNCSEYRVKPEPVEAFGYVDILTGALVGMSFGQLSAADRQLAAKMGNRIIRMIEAPEGDK